MASLPVVAQTTFPLAASCARMMFRNGARAARRRAGRPGCLRR
jgi:hypothetical protein